MNSWLLGGLVGGAVIFTWSVLVALTGIGDASVKELPSSVVVDCLDFAIEEPGLYPFPYLDVDEASEEYSYILLGSATPLLL